jgi:hypothetical protein
MPPCLSPHADAALRTQMDQREAWRPKLFHSYGPKKGLPEDFPAPTHMRRKERSSLLPSELHQGRGALFHQPSGSRGA